ncbi:MAG: L-2-amino-thiazoline-4-carboxylic acid hydrolase [Victivallales bacterium]|nr:L-2-amino-thiazoline-4-carboxylic acid hydrolase [Victivallales bacterium]
MADKITKNAFSEYKALVVELADVGGKKNPDSKFLNIAAWYLAYYRAMKPYGKTAEDVGRMIYQLNKITWKHYPENKAEKKCAAFFSVKGIKEMKKWCKWTQKREYPANWIAKFVQGEGKEFDFGYDYSHCGVCMYLYAYNARELAPFVCTNDFLKSKKLNTGLYRTKTIAMGDEFCNFRFKKGRKVTQSWDTEIEKIREHIKKGKLYHP